MNPLYRLLKPLILSGLILMSFGFAHAQEGRLIGDEPVSNSNSFLHFSAPATNISNWTLMESPLTTDNPNAVVFYTHNWNPNGDPSGTSVAPQPMGVWYEGQWSLFHQDIAVPFVPDTYFNIMAQGLGGNVFIHTSEASNISADATIIDNPLTNNQPNAILFIAPNWTASSVYHQHSVGVFYKVDLQKWVIFNQEKDPMQPNVAFNVIVKEPSTTTFVHTKVIGDNPDNSYTPLDNTYLNNNVYAQILVTQQYGAYNDSEVGVWYDGSDGTWYIYNEDLSPIPPGTRFNVHVISNDWGAGNILVNGGFEVPGTSPSEPINWTTKDKAKRKCNNFITGKDISYAGDCAIMLKGKPGFNTKLKQAGTASGGELVVDFSGHFKGKNIFGGLKAIAKLALSNGTGYKVQLDPAQLNSGTYDLDLSETASLPATIVAYKVKIKLVAPVGKVLIDEMSLSTTYAIRSADPLPLPGISGTTAVAGGPSAGQAATAQTIIEGIPGQ